ncbi:MAG: gamma-glutamyltransferase [Gemmatimonadota bacterium]|nr:gamma-glutamyltransferase [Gemmatimonadota bacterium]
MTGRAAFLLALFLPAGCGDAKENAPHPEADQGAFVVGDRPTAKTARSSAGLVVSQEPYASMAGAHVLGIGGNAVDAAVATAFALTVVEPTNSGLGGRTQILIRDPDGTVAALDGTNQVPAGYPRDLAVGADVTSGYGMIGVPGTVAALTTAHERHGSLPLAVVMAPAITLAGEGFPLGAGQAEAIARVSDDLTRYEGSRRYFLKEDGSPYRAGERLVQSDLARTLRAVAGGGAGAFYGGEVAYRIAEDMAANGGYVTASDLSGYRVLDALVARSDYRGYAVIGTYLPAGGANVQAQLEVVERAAPEPLSDGFRWAATLAQALLFGFEDRLIDLANMGPAETFPLAERMAWLLDSERLDERARGVRQPRPVPSPPTPQDRDGTFSDGHTTHLSVVDREGRAVSLTQSLGPTMGSRVAAPGLGFMYSATMGYLSGPAASAGIRALGPGDRASSRQSPSMVVAPGGTLEMVIGASGSRRILSAIVQVVSRIVDQGADLEVAMSAPRLHVEPGEPGVVYLETEWPSEVQAQLQAFGYEVRNRLGESVANVSAIRYHAATGTATGVADPRGSGAAVAVEPR